MNTQHNHPTQTSYHEQTIVAKRVAGYSCEVVMVAQDAAAIALPSPMASHQAQVPAGGYGVRAAGKAPQGDVNRGPQHTQRHAV